MANKKINELVELDAGGRTDGLSYQDLLIIYDSSEEGTQKQKKVEVGKILIPQYNPYSGYEGINLTVFDQIKSIETDGEGYYTAKITAFDAIKFIKGGDGTGIIYEISKDGLVWIQSSDPKDASIQYDCSSGPGAFLAYVRIRDYTYTSDIISMYITIYDPNFYCGAP